MILVNISILSVFLVLFESRHVYVLTPWLKIVHNTKPYKIKYLSTAPVNRIAVVMISFVVLPMSTSLPYFYKSSVTTTEYVYGYV